MSIKEFEPQYMKIGVLTAALQELTPREIRDADPDRAIEGWVVFARELGAENIQLSAALHPSESDVPTEAMLDPVANTLVRRIKGLHPERSIILVKVRPIKGFSGYWFIAGLDHRSSSTSPQTKINTKLKK